jgi:hypothetical protein
MLKMNHIIDYKTCLFSPKKWPKFRPVLLIDEQEMGKFSNKQKPDIGENCLSDSFLQ